MVIFDTLFSHTGEFADPVMCPEPQILACDAGSPPAFVFGVNRRQAVDHHHLGPHREFRARNQSYATGCRAKC